MIDPFWLLLLAVILLDILLAAARTSLLNARATHLVMMRETSPTAVDRTLALLARPRLPISLRIGVVLTHFLLAALVLIAFMRLTTPSVAAPSASNFPLLANQGLGIAFVLLSAVVLLALEYSLEGRILVTAERWALRFSPLAALLDFLLTPLSMLMLALLGYSVQQKFPEVTDADLRTWVEAGEPEGTLEKGERRMIYSIFRFGDTLAREIMVPRIDILAMEVNTPLSEARDVFSNSGHSRVPIFEETVDNIIGLLYAKDLLAVLPAEGTPLSALRSLLRPAYYVPEAKKVDDLLNELQSRRIHMAVVVDEYGGVAGLVTLEDIMEEIIGEIQDEYDQAEELLYQQMGQDEYLFNGRIDLDDFNEIMGSHLEKESADTLGGFIYREMGRIPSGGESIEAERVVLKIEQVTGRRIRKVRARKLQPAEEMEIEQNDADR